MAIVIFLTTTGTGITWNVPSDWNSASNTVEAIGAGANGIVRNGGGGGAYAKTTNVSLTPGGTTTYNIGAGDSFVDTQFKNGATLVAAAAFDQNGGTAAASTGTTKFNGGTGGTASSTAGAGGGGAGGLNGAGANGTNCSSTSNGSNGGSGDAGSGGAGGSGGVGSGNGSAGASGMEYDSSHGSGGGGGGGGGSDPGNGGAAGNYGAGGGGAGKGTAGSGAQGLIIITYTSTVVDATGATSFPAARSAWRSVWSPAFFRPYPELAQPPTVIPIVVADSTPGPTNMLAARRTWIDIWRRQYSRPFGYLRGSETHSVPTGQIIRNTLVRTRILKGP